MQFPYDSMDESLDFEQEVRKRLFAIENMLTNFSAQNDLVQELIRKETRSYTTTTTEPKNLSFVITTVKNQDHNPLNIRITGRTYDIRDRIKQFGQANWKGEIKAWELEYSDERYHNIVEYLTTLTTDVSEELLVVVV